MIRPILNVADPREAATLKQISKPVAQVDERVRTLVADMIETMYDAPGIGLAAIQVGVPDRIIVMDLGERDPAAAPEGQALEVDAAPAPAERRPRVFINPEITWRSEELFTYEEGCLSVPAVFDGVERPARCKVRYLDLDGNPREEDAEGLFAVCIQHEMDHLEGVLFIDYLSRLKRERAVKAARKSLPKAAA